MVKTASSREATAADIESSSVVILAGVSALSEAFVAGLEEFVSSGGGLLVFPGGVRRTGARFRPDGTEFLPDEKTYDELLWRGGEGLLPSRLGRPVGKLSDPGRYFYAESFKELHPVFSVFGGELGRQLGIPRVFRCFTLEQEDVSRPEVRVLVELDNGGPLAVEKSYGRGRVILFATSASDDWSDLPKRKAYLPLVHQMVRHLASGGRAGSRNLTVGDVLSFTPPALPEGAELTIEDPGGERLAAGMSPVAESPGIYTATVSTAGGRSIRYAAANLPVAESDLRPARAEDVISALSTAEGADEGLPDGQTRLSEDSSRELKVRAPYWRYLVIAILGILLLESFVANVRLRRLLDRSAS
jgi:hypothetical protein